MALVPVAPIQFVSRSYSSRLHPDPSFVMHLIATANHAPQTRRLRQASAGDGAAHYAAVRAAIQPPAPHGTRLDIA